MMYKLENRSVKTTQRTLTPGKKKTATNLNCACIEAGEEEVFVALVFVHASVIELNCVRL